MGTLVLSLLLLAIGCGGGGSNSSGTAAVSTAPIDLEPGQTTALMAWEPSDGQVVGYLVFQSHDEEAFKFLATVTTPQIQISGAPGDSIRILVVALGATNSESAASPPSPPVRFHAAIEAVAAISAAASSAPSLTTTALAPQTQPVEAETSGADESLADAEGTDSDSGNGSDTTRDSYAGDTTDPSGDADAADADLVSIDPALRARLLSSNPRFPFAGLAPEAQRWIQSLVDAQVGAGVSLAGSGELGGDALRELVWIDSSGQLFVSDGSLVATVEDLPSTFVEAIRLGPTERFAGLDDFDGDGVGDWVVEDTATGDIWILRNGSGDVLFEHIAALKPDLLLVGHGDFDGDGLTELLWQHTDSTYRIGVPAAEPSPLDWISAEDEAAAAARSMNTLLIVADLNGDGRDDLVFRGADGVLEFALSRSGEAGPEFEWRFGPETTTHGLELIATLDFDQNGTAEIVWWVDGALEIWDLQDSF